MMRFWLSQCSYQNLYRKWVGLCLMGGMSMTCDNPTIAPPPAQPPAPIVPPPVISTPPPPPSEPEWLSAHDELSEPERQAAIQRIVKEAEDYKKQALRFLQIRPDPSFDHMLKEDWDAIINDWNSRTPGRAATWDDLYQRYVALFKKKQLEKQQEIRARQYKTAQELLSLGCELKVIEQVTLLSCKTIVKYLLDEAGLSIQRVAEIVGVTQAEVKQLRYGAPS